MTLRFSHIAALTWRGVLVRFLIFFFCLLATSAFADQPYYPYNNLGFTPANAAHNANVIDNYGAVGTTTYNKELVTSTTGASSCTINFAQEGYYPAPNFNDHSDNVGKPIEIGGIGVSGATLTTTIAAVSSATQVVVNSPCASTAVSGTEEGIVYGYDDTTALQNAFNASPTQAMYVPCGTYRITQQLYIPNGGYVYSRINNPYYSQPGYATSTIPPCALLYADGNSAHWENLLGYLTLGGNTKVMDIALDVSATDHTANGIYSSRPFNWLVDDYVNYGSIGIFADIGSGTSWSSTIKYVPGDNVYYTDGNIYTAAAPSVGQTPSGSSSYWTLWFSNNAWSSSTNYVAGNAVYVGSSAYVAIASNTNQTPPNATYWKQLPGPTGAINQGWILDNVQATNTSSDCFRLSSVTDTVVRNSIAHGCGAQGLNIVSGGTFIITGNTLENSVQCGLNIYGIMGNASIANNKFSNNISCSIEFSSWSNSPGKAISVTGNIFETGNYSYLITGSNNGQIFASGNQYATSGALYQVCLATGASFTGQSYFNEFWPIPGGTGGAIFGASGGCTGTLSNGTIPSMNISNFPSGFGVPGPYSAAGTAIPACSASLTGRFAYATDITTLTYNATYATGGTNTGLLFCNGTNWTAH